jgi:Family of unknown function (DUF6480)
MTDEPTGPDPSRTPGLEPGGGVPPGETPPAAGSESESAIRTPAPKDRQTPAALVVVIGLVVLVGVLFLVWAVVVAIR